MTTPDIMLGRFDAPGLPGLRLTARGRAVLAALLSVLLGVAAVAAVLSSAPTAPMARDRGVDAAVVAAGASGAELAAQGLARPYTVREGDTLWDLAVPLAGDGDPRPVVDRIAQINALPGPSLSVGQQLWLPGEVG